jgi:DinB family protein
MHDSVRPVAQLYGVNTQLLERALDGLDEGDLRRPPAEGMNPPLWIAGHVASVRFSLCAMLGAPRDNPFGKTFFRGSALDLAALPELSAVRRTWTEVSALLLEKLEEATAEQLEAPAPKKFAIDDATVRGSLTFLCWHEGYHIGQLSLLRKWRGLSGLVG